MTTKVKCPTCSTQVIWSPESEFRPFCSKRCQLIDLGEWASENNKIAQSPVVSDLTEADIDKIESLLAKQENEFFQQ
jgi:hypothetical protein